MKEQHKLKMVIDYEAGKVRAQRAAELLGISKRQFRRLVAAYRQRGGAAHPVLCFGISSELEG
jgi:predicted DNA-binding transcriptional regulator YafY